MTKILVLYQYYHPDDVVSARHYADLCEGLSAKGFEVEVWPSNRACHDLKATYTTKPETINGVSIHRVWRPPFSQHSFLGRIFNSIWMQKRWGWRLLLSSATQPDVILTGTDPLFAVLLIPFLKMIRPKAKIVHWCFDLYPEAAIADGMLRENGPLVKLTRNFLKKGYAKCDLVADLGPCMRSRLEAYPTAKRATLTPWALEEPSEPLKIDDAERKELFGPVSLALLYSGNMGRAHDFYINLKLAQMMRDTAAFTYSVRGSRVAALKLAVNPEYTNIRFAPFAPPDKLTARLAAPDVHVVSLRPEWTGTVVPSKFFGALAVGRPVLFEGDEHSSLALWIKEYGVGWVLGLGSMVEVAAELVKFSKDAKKKAEMFKRCHRVYQDHFSKAAILAQWESELKQLAD